MTTQVSFYADTCYVDDGVVAFDNAGLRFVVGEEFKVEYINELPEPTLIHAHGLTPPHGLDGVPFVDAPPIEPGRAAVYV